MSTEVPGKKFTSNGADSQLLQQLVMSTSIDNMSAKEVREHYPQFQEYPLNNFRVNLKRYRERANKTTTVAEDNISETAFMEQLVQPFQSQGTFVNC
jgi:ABC-type transporter MlaC component